MTYLGAIKRVHFSQSIPQVRSRKFRGESEFEKRLPRLLGRPSCPPINRLAGLHKVHFPWESSGMPSSKDAAGKFGDRADPDHCRHRAPDSTTGLRSEGRRKPVGPVVARMRFASQRRGHSAPYSVSCQNGYLVSFGPGDEAKTWN